MPLFDDPETTVRIIEEARRRTERMARVASSTPERVALDAGRWHRNYPWLEPGVVLSLARSGLNPASPEGLEIARAGADARSQSGLGWLEPGQQELAGRAIRAGIRGAARARRSEPKVSHSSIFPGLAEIGSGLTGAVSDVGDVGKKAVRGLGTALNAGGQEVQGLYRKATGILGDAATGEYTGPAGAQKLQHDLREAAKPESDLAIILEQLWKGEPVDIGSGFSVGERSAVAQERHRRELRWGTVNGHSRTIGRDLAQVLVDVAPFEVEPDSTPYNVLSGLVDGYVAIKGDPTNALSGWWSKKGPLSASRKLLDSPGDLDETVNLAARLEAGVLPAAQKIDEKTAAGWLVGSDDGKKLVDKLTEADNFYDVYFGTGAKMRPETALKIARSTDRDEVLRLVFDEIGLDGASLGQKLKYKPPWKIKAPAYYRRLTGTMPERVTDLRDQAAAIQAIERRATLLKLSGDETRTWVNAMARAENVPRRRAVVNDFLSGEQGVLVSKYGVDPDLAKQFTAYSKNLDDLSTYYGSVGRDPFMPWDRSPMSSLSDDALDDALRPLKELGVVGNRSRALMYSQMFPHTIEWPDARRLARVTSDLQRWKPLLTSNRTEPYEIAAFGKKFQVWPEKLHRPGELRLPLAAIEKLSNSLWRPLQLITRPAWPMRQVVLDEGLRMATAGHPSFYNHTIHYIATAMFGQNAGLKTNLAGDALSATDKFSRSMLKGAGGLLDTRQSMQIGAWRWVGQDSPDFYRLWGSVDLGQMHADPIVKQYVLNDLDLEKTTEWLLRGKGQGFRKDMSAVRKTMGTDEGAEWYLREVVHPLVMDKTGGDPDLLNVIRTGRLHDMPIMLPGTHRSNPDFVKALKGYDHVAPKMSRGPAVIAEGTGARMTEVMNAAADFMFGLLGAYPSNKLSRSQVFHQLYWQNVSDMGGFGDKTTVDFIKKAAGRKDMPKEISKKLLASVSRGTSGQSSWADIDEIAKMRALDGTKKLLMDLGEKGNFMDAMRVVFPFGSAWAEQFKVWGGLLARNPRGIRRAQQGLEAFRDTGTFHENQYGEMVFDYPLTGQMAQALYGANIPMQGRAQGLTMALEIMPGWGPSIQLGANWLIPHTPVWDDTRKIFTPFGADQSVFQSFMPAWIEKVQAGLASPGAPEPLRRAALFFDDSVARQREFGSATIDVLRYLRSTGAYPNTPEGNAQLAADAEHKAMIWYIFRGLAQSTLPSAPAADWQVMDPEGELIEVRTLTKIYNEMKDEDEDTARLRFLNEYGDLAFMVLQSKSRETTASSPTNAEADAFLREHKKQAAAYPDIIGLYAPTSESFDYQAYLRSLDEGARDVYTPEEYIAASNQQIGALKYAAMRDKAGPTMNDRQRAILREYQEKLIHDYPGYDPMAFQNRVPGWINQLERSLEDPDLAETEAGQGLKLYLAARDKAKEVAERRGLAPNSFATAKQMEAVRSKLRDIGEEISETHPEFFPMWDNVFSRELGDDLSDDEEQEED